MIGDNIKQRRKKLGLTMQMLADQVEVTASTINKWEKGQIKNIKQDTIEKLAKALDTTPLELMDFDTNADYILSDNDEIKLIKCYRNSNERIRQAIRLLLYQEALKDNKEAGEDFD